MKKLLSLTLAIVLILGLCACGGSGSEGGKEDEYTGLQVGYNRQSILPTSPVQMAGYGNQGSRLSTGYLDIIYATCTAFRENGNTILLFALDLLRTESNWTEDYRNAINEATGVPKENIMFCASHTHSAPAPGGNEAEVQKWKTEVVDTAIVKAAEKAIEDLAPATLYTTTVKTENMTYVRHYELVDGTYCGDNFGDGSKQRVGHATKANEDMVLLKADREGDKKDIMLMNFQAHPCFTGGSTKTDISSDFIGATRNVFEAKTGMQFIYFTGTAGNQNTVTKMPDEIPNSLSSKGMQTYSETLAQYAIDAMDNMTPVEGSGIKTQQLSFEYESNKIGQDRLDDARVIFNYAKETGNMSAATDKAKTMGFISVYECQAIVRASGYPATRPMELNVLSIGDLGIVTTPCELFSDTGLYIREHSPFKTTLLLSLANEVHGYYPTKQAYDYYSYESWSSQYASGVAEAMADKLVEMLKGL
ncbi:MAG: hypothetical protein IKJ94_07430 [Oscillospiraceae bacterium]|nr:hypothetical protein [Oscillospiraceae bacterium]